MLNSSLTAFGAWPGVTAKVVDGVNAMSRRAAAATKAANANGPAGDQKTRGFLVRLDLESRKTIGLSF